MNKKRILSIFMTFCIIASMVLGTHTEVLAKGKAIKIGFDGKSVTMGLYRGEAEGKEPETLSEVEEYLGEKTRLSNEEEAEGYRAYIWEKGKTKIIISEDADEDGLGYASAEIKDKNGSIAGVKVGMTKAKALKKLKKVFGSKNVTADKKGIYTKSLLEIYLKNGKVSRISWMRS